MREYSYFRADGRSLQAVERVQEAKENIKELSKKLAQRYGASEYAGWARDDFGTFVFKKGTPVPETFERQDDSDQSEDFQRSQPIFAWPKKGTKDAFYVANFKGLIDRQREYSRLENIFECGDMPRKKLPAGRYSEAFVREKSWISGDFNSYARQGTNDGKIQDPMIMCFGSGSDCEGSDPLSFLTLIDEVYIRVPNDEAGRPRFVPPDSTPVSYEEILDIDEQEYCRRHPHYKPLPRKQFGP